MDTVTLSSKGQLVIPKAVREHAQVVPGSQFSVHYVDGEIRLRPLAAWRGLGVGGRATHRRKRPSGPG
jgi:AbrB family looped-hinge helix DNA binding protein